jgi:hypothetical protein
MPFTLKRHGAHRPVILQIGVVADKRLKNRIAHADNPREQRDALAQLGLG